MSTTPQAISAPAHGTGIRRASMELMMEMGRRSQGDVAGQHAMSTTPTEQPSAPARCAGCDIPNGCPEYCRCKPQPSAPLSSNPVALNAEAIYRVMNSAWEMHRCVTDCGVNQIAKDLRTFLESLAAPPEPPASLPSGDRAANPQRRTPTDYALEFADYLAQGAKEFMESALALTNVQHQIDETGEDMPAELQAACDSFDESLRSLRNDVYEYRKRRDRAAALAPVEPLPMSDAEIEKAIYADEAMLKKIEGRYPRWHNIVAVRDEQWRRALATHAPMGDAGGQR